MLLNNEAVKEEPSDAFEHFQGLFSWSDYLIFCSMLIVSAVIGVYYGCFGTKQKSTADYLHGGKSMRVVPIAISLVASHLSGITLLGLPAEIYAYGTQYWMCGISVLLVAIITSYVYLPVFYKLQLTSTYEYLKYRFGHGIRTTASLLYALHTLLYVPIVIYVPSLAFNQMTGISINTIAPIVCAVCIFYTTLGGLKAVVWTDTLQFIVTFSTMVLVMVMGVVEFGGFGNIWRIADRGKRLEFFNMDLDPTERSSFWGVVVGLTVSWVSNMGVNPSSIQRFLAVSSLKKAKVAMVVFCVGIFVSKSISIFSGLIIYAKYEDCDPISAGKVKRIDQVVPMFILDMVMGIPGLAGLFVAGIFNTALSTMSTNLNTLSGIIYQDFLRKRMPDGTSDERASTVMKFVVIVSGLLCLTLVFFVEKLGGILQLSITLGGVTNGPLLGLFTVGMLFPYVNAEGALAGGIGATAIILLIVGGKEFYTLQGLMRYPKKPMSIEGCNFLNSTIITAAVAEHPPWLFRISFYYYSLIGAALVIIIALPVSKLTRKKDDPPAHPDLISPCVHWMIPEDQKPAQYRTVECALTQLNGIDEKSKLGSNEKDAANGKSKLNSNEMNGSTNGNEKNNGY